MTRSSRGFDPAPLLWCSAAIVFAAAVLFVARPLENRIKIQQARTAADQERAATIERALARRGALDGTLEQLRSNLHGVALRASRIDATAGLLADSEALAHREGVQLLGIRPLAPQGNIPPALQPRAISTPPAQRASPAVATHPNAGTTPQFGDEPFELTTRGSFRATLRFLQHLSMMRTPTRVEAVVLERAAHQLPAQTAPLVDGKFRVAAIRVSVPALP